MDSKLTPQNKTAQLHYRALGNPINTLPKFAISNCFPGLEYDFKNFWRRAFMGIVLLEWDNYVIGIEDPQYQYLLHHRLLMVDGRPVVTTLDGPRIPEGSSVPLPSSEKPAVVTMEWSNALAFVRNRHGQKVKCSFTLTPSPDPQPIPKIAGQMMDVDLILRPIFDGDSAAPAEGLLQPGELTQGLCSPWQHDYRECSCYYWPASRPDYVNVVPTPQGVSTGDNWLSKDRTGAYILDDRKDLRLVTYDNLFQNWEKELHFQIKGRDVKEK